MNAATFDEFGRMTANLGVEAVPATPAVAEHHPLPVRQPVDRTDRRHQPAQGRRQRHPDRLGDDGTQIWKITHNGVDTHPIHFHLYDVQVLNRVTWDNIIIPPDANELGWKDTVRVSPLEDTIVALRPIIPIAAVRAAQQHPAAEPDDARPGGDLGVQQRRRERQPDHADRQQAGQLRLGVRLPLPHPEP